jgi:transposase
MVCGELCAKRLVFVDEMGSNTSLHELYAYSARGERAYCSVAPNRAKNTTLLSSMTFCGMGPSMVVEGGTDGAVFEGYLREMLVPALRKGEVVVMDNLSVHKSERVRELMEAAGAHLLYLPPYSPEFNPIEEAFSKIKNLIRKAGARVHEALVVALGEAICEVSEEDAKAYFEHCGYREAVQLL